MYRSVYMVLLAIVLFGCKKHNRGRQSLEELLTNGKWLLAGYGYDDNNNGSLDTEENLIIDCQKDNTIQYRRNGTGESLENQQVCMADPVVAFEWKFIDGEKAIEIQNQRLDIHTLTGTDLHFVIQIPGVSPGLHTLYRKL